MFIKTELDRPILFRTVGKDVYRKSVHEGSIWLRSSHYYRDIEDRARSDRSEGVNGTKSLVPLRFHFENDLSVTLQGPGSVGREIIPHYILSMHGTAISDECRSEFGGCTFGIKCIQRLAAEILYKASKQLDVFSYRFGQVSYQHTALSISYNGHGAAISLGGNPAVALRSVNTDVLRKEPAVPFIHQDEWRIAIFPTKYLNDDANEPLKLNVSPDHFFEYGCLE
jgi:hypothetical protein